MLRIQDALYVYKCVRFERFIISYRFQLICRVRMSVLILDVSLGVLGSLIRSMHSLYTVFVASYCCGYLSSLSRRLVSSAINSKENTKNRLVFIVLKKRRKWITKKIFHAFIIIIADGWWKMRLLSYFHLFFFFLYFCFALTVFLSCATLYAMIICSNNIKIKIVQETNIFYTEKIKPCVCWMRIIPSTCCISCGKNAWVCVCYYLLW